MRVITHPDDRKHLMESYAVIGGVYIMAALASALLGFIVLGMISSAM